MADGRGDAAALDVLAHETRLAILRALAEQIRETPDDPAVRFAELRTAVGTRDSGNFSYHLDKLTGWLVEEGDDGYTLSTSGIRALSALERGVGGSAVDLDAEPLDGDCPNCGDQLTATYEDGTFIVSCPEGEMIGDVVPAHVVSDRSTEDALAHLLRNARRGIEQLVAGSCAVCDGRVERAPVGSDGASGSAFHFVCSRCGAPYGVPAGGVALAHPATTWFAYERGVDLADRPWLVLEHLFDARSERVSDDPVRIEVEFEVDGDVLALVVDDTPGVVDVDPAPPS